MGGGDTHGSEKEGSQEEGKEEKEISRLRLGRSSENASASFSRAGIFVSPHRPLSGLQPVTPVKLSLASRSARPNTLSGYRVRSLNDFFSSKDRPTTELKTT
jgi:hypothetical protein